MSLNMPTQVPTRTDFHIRSRRGDSKALPRAPVQRSIHWMLPHISSFVVTTHPAIFTMVHLYLTTETTRFSCVHFSTKWTCSLQMGSKEASGGSTPKAPTVITCSYIPYTRIIGQSVPATQSGKSWKQPKHMHNTRRPRVKSQRRKSARPVVGGYPELLSIPLIPNNKAQVRNDCG